MALKNIAILAITLISLLVMLPYGLEKLAYAMLVAGCFDFLINTWVLKKVIGLEVIDFVRAMVPNIILALVCGFATYVISVLIDFSVTTPFVSVGVVASVLPVVWIVTVGLLRHPLYFELRSIVMNRLG
jgi:peptidoglycan biosynthesis protein MviN/MurJ (putative lipid II flippase)